MSHRSNWLRCNREVHCPVCSPHGEHTGYCMVHRSGQVAICGRVESDHPIADGMGWIHKLNGTVFRPAPVVHRTVVPPVPVRDFSAFARECFDRCTSREQLAASLGVSVASLVRLDCGWCEDPAAWTFPMRDGARRIIGIRTRSRDGAKRAIVGSHNGLFIPDNIPTREPLWICEGPTDTAALVTLGYSAIGRPSNAAGGDFIVAFARAWTSREVVIIADRDGEDTDAERATVRAAHETAARLREIGKRVRVLRSLHKDVRDDVRAGATRAVFECRLAQVTP